jgi:hypothetical protein
MAELRLAAQWTDDCFGKKDYDGDILSVSTRYWPDCTAHSSLILWTKYEDCRDDVRLIDKDFEAASFEELAPQVEAWAQEQMDKAFEALRADFGIPAVPSGAPLE